MLGARQKKQTRAELEREGRRRAQRELQALRAQLKAARAQRKVRLKAVTANCRAARRSISQRAKQARARLNASIARTRTNARTLCSASRGQAKHETLSAMDKALAALERERVEQKKLRIWLDKSPSSRAQAGRGRAERQSESDHDVANNIDDPGLRIVWEAVKSKIRPRGRTSRTEVFAEWVAEHPSDVYAIQEADAERALHALERQELLLAKALKRARYEAPRELAAVPF